jgi:ribosome-binding protein aMBF1 (putative translation factor)
MKKSDYTSMPWSEIQKKYDADPAFRSAYDAAQRALVVGEAVRKARRARGLTQAQLAAATGTSQSAIARLELGGGNPRLDTLARIATALGAELSVRFVKAKAG